MSDEVNINNDEALGLQIDALENCITMLVNGRALPDSIHVSALRSALPEILSGLKESERNRRATPAAPAVPQISSMDMEQANRIAKNAEGRFAHQTGTWVLMSPDGREWTGDSPLAVVRAERDERIPASVQLARVLSAADEPEPAAPALAEATPAAQWRADGQPDPHGTHYDCERAKLTLGKLTDDELANGAFMNYDRLLSVADMLNPKPGQHMPIIWMTAVKDRIRWLSRALANATSPAAVVVPTGWVMVPEEITPEIVGAMATVEASMTINGVKTLGMAGAEEAWEKALAVVAKEAK